MPNSLKPYREDLPGGGTVRPADGPQTPAQQVRGGARPTTLSQRLNGNPRA